MPKMGTDINVFVEVNVDGEWKSADLWQPSDYKNEYYVYYKNSIYYDRNYTLFSIFADVRNCAGERYITPIDQPRGFPFDLSEILQKHLIDRKEFDRAKNNSASWLLLSELLNYNWNYKLNITDIYVPQVEYLDYLQDKNKIPSWFKKTSLQIYAKEGVTYYELSNLEIPLSYYCDNFLKKSLVKLLLFGIPENVRIVFYFD